MDGIYDEYKEKGKELQLVSFYLGQEEFGVDILQVQEINRMLPISRIPKAPDHVEGIINLRGKVIPIVNLRTRFGMEKRENDKQTRIIVVDIDGRKLGLIVDSVAAVLRLPANTVEPTPPIVSGTRSTYIRGVGKRGEKLLLLLDLEKLFCEAEHRELQNAIDAGAASVQ